MRFQLVGRDVTVVTFHLDSDPGMERRRTLVFVCTDAGWQIAHLHASNAPRPVKLKRGAAMLARVVQWLPAWPWRGAVSREGIMMREPSVGQVTLSRPVTCTPMLPRMSLTMQRTRTTVTMRRAGTPIRPSQPPTRPMATPTLTTMTIVATRIPAMTTATIVMASTITSTCITAARLAGSAGCSAATATAPRTADEALEGSAEGIRAVKISLVALFVTAVLQLAVVAFSGSVALLADTIHNFADALTSIPLWIAFIVGRRAANRRYTYGYGRAEDLAGLAIVIDDRPRAQRWRPGSRSASCSRPSRSAISAG